LLILLEMNVRYERCLGSELFTADGGAFSFLSVTACTTSGTNHPAVIAAIREELESCGPAMIQTHVAERAGELGGSCASAQAGD